MKVFVTGGTGFIGVPLIRVLRDRGHQVSALARNPEAAAKLLPEGVTFHHGDLHDPAALAAAMRGHDAVFHLAGLISYREKDRKRVRAVNVDGTRNVMQAALDARVDRVVHTSSIVAVGVSWDSRDMMDETMEYNAQPLKLEYFDAKHAAELAVQEAHAQGLNVVTVNPATVVGIANECGPPGNVNEAIRLLSRLPILLPGGNCWVDVVDVVSGLMLALEKGRSGERYILGGANVSNAEITRRLSKFIGHRSPVVQLPRPTLLAGRAAVRVLEMVGVKIPPGSQAFSRISGFYLYFDSRKARNELGWQPRTPWLALERMALMS